MIQTCENMAISRTPKTVGVALLDRWTTTPIVLIPCWVPLCISIPAFKAEAFRKMLLVSGLFLCWKSCPMLSATERILFCWTQSSKHKDENTSLFHGIWIFEKCLYAMLTSFLKVLAFITEQLSTMVFTERGNFEHGKFGDRQLTWISGEYIHPFPFHLPTNNDIFRSVTFYTRMQLLNLVKFGCIAAECQQNTTGNILFIWIWIN